MPGLRQACKSPLRHNGLAEVAHAFKSNTWEGQSLADLCEFEISLVYMLSSRPVRIMVSQQNEGYLLGIHRASPAPHHVDPSLWLGGSGLLYQHQAQGNYFPPALCRNSEGPSRNDGGGGGPGRVTPSFFKKNWHSPPRSWHKGQSIMLWQAALGTSPTLLAMGSEGMAAGKV